MGKHKFELEALSAALDNDPRGIKHFLDLLSSSEKHALGAAALHVAVMTADQPNKPPTKPGVYWAAFDDSEQITEVVLLNVKYFGGETSFAEGAHVDIIDGKDRWFEIWDINERLIQPTVNVATAIGVGSLKEDQVRITWLGEVAPPAVMPTMATTKR